MSMLMTLTFSTESIRSTRTFEKTLAFTIALKVRQFSDQTAQKLEKKESINMRPLFQALSTDIICVCCFGCEFNIITNEDDPANISRTTDLVASHLWKGSRKAGIIDSLLDASQAGTWESPDQELLVEQVFSLVFAGIDTSSIALTSGFWHILSCPGVLRRLQEELRSTTPDIGDTYDWKKVRRLPYLSAVVKETMRISSPAPGRFPRVVPPEGVHHKSSFIPGGTTISSSIYLIHQNPNLFPEPEKFLPERWLAEDSISLEKYIVAFSKGSRSCPGIHLAYLEIYTVLATFFNRFDMELLSPTTEEGLAWSDHGVAVFKSPLKL
ncbi:hypothetical protein PENARI_c022G08547 [Penicillium arizonense]|uniref:Cytochrome P450 n=1 Tax=Penicillium arizonense TaxID=1835702 RepID=A0A1F5L7X0_PENAI|nr:hypothetical protein PENARI_c022G08547 [Penicillium arizonense]OGE49313.1 hypothetical protein PENARI_c022G08547 [Penicillium arizonense]